MEKECGLIDWLRKPKVRNMSIFDWVATFLGAMVLAYFLYGKNTNLSTILILFTGLVALGIIVHKLTSTPTMLNYYLGLNNLTSVLENRKDCK